MCMLKAASAAITLAKEAVRSDAVVRDPELLRCLSDMLIHLGVWRAECVVMVHNRPAAAAADIEDADEPTAIVGG
ncbi:MAG TPA: hypothetical protein VD866_13150 [Urbifossiella sp.]|nr:hypothetical protein [Urbifossiella sp.]